MFGKTGLCFLCIALSGPSALAEMSAECQADDEPCKSTSGLAMLQTRTANRKTDVSEDDSTDSEEQSIMGQQALLQTAGARFAKVEKKANMLSDVGGSRINTTAEQRCTSHGGGCWTDSNCCGEMQCLGVHTWQCGNSPGLDGEFCNAHYPCDEHLLCHHGRCTDYKDVLLQGTKGTCKAGSSSGKIKVMSYNLFLIQCLLPGRFGGSVLTCEPEADQKVRIPKLMEWMKDRDEDVVMVQELFHLRDEVIDGMAAAGFCHYVSSPFGQDGSGMAIFSKYEIKTIDFIDWFDWTGSKSDTLYNPEAIADKGVMYAKIEKDGKNYHVFDTHTQSDSMGDAHSVRMGQYLKFREFAQSLNLPSSELILFGGDFNEDKYRHHNEERYYNEMLEELHAFEPTITSSLNVSLSTHENPFLANLWAGTSTDTFIELLDYVLVSKNGKKPSKSHCEILKPQWPKDCGEAICMLSDHFPNTCTFEA